MKTGHTISIAVAALCAGCVLGLSVARILPSRTRPRSDLLPVSWLLRQGTNRVIGTVSAGDYFYSFTEQPLAFPFTLPQQHQRLMDGIESALLYDGERTLGSAQGRTNAGYVKFPVPREDHLTFEIIAVVTNAHRIFLTIGREKTDAEPVAPHEPPPRVSAPDSSEKRPLDPPPAPDSSGGR